MNDTAEHWLCGPALQRAPGTPLTLLGSRCQGCRQVVFPEATVCPACGGESLQRTDGDGVCDGLDLGHRMGEAGAGQHGQGDPLAGRVVLALAQQVRQ